MSKKESELDFYYTDIEGVYVLAFRNEGRIVVGTAGKGETAPTVVRYTDGTIEQAVLNELARRHGIEMDGSDLDLKQK